MRGNTTKQLLIRTLPTVQHASTPKPCGVITEFRTGQLKVPPHQVEFEFESQHRCNARVQGCWTGSCLQSDNDVSTSNIPPALNIVMIYPDYYIETCISKYQNTTEFFFTQIWKTKMLRLQKHSNPFLFSANTPMTINQKNYLVFSIDHFESICQP